MSSDYQIFGLLTLVAIINGIWNIVAIKFISINKQELYAGFVLLIYAVILFVLPILGMGYIELIFLLLGSEIVIALFLFRLMRSYRFEKKL